MSDRWYADDLVRAEALVRGWSLIVVLAVTAALPLLWVRGVEDDDHYETALGAVPYLLTTGDGDLGSGQPGVQVTVWLMRATAVLLVASLLLALLVAVEWCDSAVLVAPSRWLRTAAGGSLVVAALAVLLTAAFLHDPDDAAPSRYEGVDAGPGVMLLLVATVMLLASPTTGSWPRSRRG